MFFFLSKTLNYLVMPLTIVCLCLLLTVFLRNAKWKKRFFWIGFGLLLLFSNHFMANECMRAWEIAPTPLHDVGKHKLGIVLTGVTIQQFMPADRVYFQRGADRVTHTVQLYKEGYIEKILVSGGSGRIIDINEPEANSVKRALVLMGVPEENIIIENQTRNTYESAVAVKPMLDSLNIQDRDCLLITSAFHMRRSLACYRKAGLDIKPFTTDFYSHPGPYHLDSFIVPKVDALVIWNKLVKEWVGFVAYKLAGYV